MYQKTVTAGCVLSIGIGDCITVFMAMALLNNRIKLIFAKSFKKLHHNIVF